MISRRIQHFVVAALALGALAAPASAFAQSAAQDGYNPPAGQIQDEVAQEGGGGGAPGGPGGGEGAPQPTGGGALPFTGMDLVLLLGGGGLLLSAGLGMRRLARGPDPA